jgi:hypothetical protein
MGLERRGQVIAIEIESTGDGRNPLLYGRRQPSRDGAIAIDLIDGDRLCDLLKQHELGVKTKMIEIVTVEANWFSGI